MQIIRSSLGVSFARLCFGDEEEFFAETFSKYRCSGRRQSEQQTSRINTAKNTNPLCLRILVEKKYKQNQGQPITTLSARAYRPSRFSNVARGQASGIIALGGGGREKQNFRFLPNRPRPLSSFDTHARWQPVTQSARSRRSYGKIEDCEQSRSSSYRG